MFGKIAKDQFIKDVIGFNERIEQISEEIRGFNAPAECYQLAHNSIVKSIDTYIKDKLKSTPESVCSVVNKLLNDEYSDIFVGMFGDIDYSNVYDNEEEETISAPEDQRSKEFRSLFAFQSIVSELIR